MPEPRDPAPSQALAEAVVAALATGGVRDVVLAPGSRSAPMAYALLAAEDAGALRLHVSIDERSAGFVALGLAVATGRPVPVVVTSGSAVANLHPALLEAAHQRVPLVVVSCDRPAELVRRGGSQTTEHVGVFGSPDGVAGGISRPRATADLTAADLASVTLLDLLDVARGPLPGPVHLNVAFADPLVPVPPVRSVRIEAPSDAADGTSSAASAPVRAPEARVATGSIRTERTSRTVMLAGDGAVRGGRPDLPVAWPVLAEPTVDLPGALGSVPVLLDALGDDVERVVVLGRPTLSRQQTALLARPDVEVVLVDPPGHAWLDGPGARHVPAGWLADEVEESRAAGDADDPGWSDRWHAAARAVAAELDAEVELALAGAPIEGWTAARLVSRAAARDGGLLVAGASMAIRQLDLAGLPAARVVSNRGLAGIDGTVSTALGHALAADVGRAAGDRPVRALLGDLTLQHDLGGLVRGRLERPVDLQLVVLADDGGSIFATLEHGRPELAAAHERVFATPQALDLAAVAAGVGARYVLVDDASGLAAALTGVGRGIEIVEVRLSRSGAAERRRALHRRLVDLVRAG